MSNVGDLMADLEVALENTYMDPLTRVWLTRVITTLEDEGWNPTTKQQPQKSEPGPEQMTFPSEDEDTSPSTSSKGTTKSTPSDPSATATQSEG